jgi:acyl carrier protein
MTRAEILPRLQRVAAGIFGCAPDVVLETTVATDVAKWDSLRHLIFISAVEQEFGVEFDMDAIANLTDVAALVTLIERQAA